VDSEDDFTYAKEHGVDAVFVNDITKFKGCAKYVITNNPTTSKSL
jgi:hypothetical protein